MLPPTTCLLLLPGKDFPLTCHQQLHTTVGWLICATPEQKQKAESKKPKRKVLGNHFISSVRWAPLWLLWQFTA